MVVIIDPIVKLMKGWNDIILSRIESDNVILRDGIQKQLISVLVDFIIYRWFILFQDKTIDVEKFYEESHKRTIGAIVAIVELLESIGEGKSMPDSYIKMLKEI